MDNLKLLQYCINHPEKFLDYSYVFVKTDPKLKSYQKRTTEIKELLITIKNIKNKKESQNTLAQILIELQQKLKKYANYSEFGSFINACDSTIEENINDLGLLKRIMIKRKIGLWLI